MGKEIDFDTLVIVAGGHNAAQLLFAGEQLGLYDLLSKQPGVTLVEIAEGLSIAPYPCRVLLIGLTALGIIVKEEDRFRNAALIEQTMVKGKPGSAAPILGWQAHIVYPGMQDFVEALKQGTNVGLRHFPGEGNNLYQRLASHPKLENIFQDAMGALSSQANAFLSEAYDFGQFSHMVDCGGGAGHNAILLAKRYPKLKVTVYDSETVCALARKNIAAQGLSDRVFTHVGNFLMDPFPSDADAFLFCHIGPIFSMARNLQILKKCAQALPDNGAVLLFNMMGDDDDTGPLSTALGSPYFLTLATGEGMLHAWKDYEGAMAEAGFTHITRVDHLPLNHGLIVGNK